MTGTVAPEIKPGSLLGEYRLGALIGSGGYGRVYAARHTILEHEVAIKVIAYRQGRDLLGRVSKEARALSRIDHPNIVRVLTANIAEDNSHAYIVMERLFGVDARRALQSLRCLTVPEVLEIGVQLCAGIAAAHAVGVVHRDLKPANIFLRPGNRVCIVDFGIAKLLGQRSDSSREFRWQGTLEYMSPEIIRGTRGTPLGDIYSVGVVLYELLTGRHYLRSNAALDEGDVFATGIAIGEYVPPPLIDLVPSTPPALSYAVAKSMAKHPADRYQSAAELGAFLVEIQRAFQEDVAAGMLPEQAGHPGPWRAAIRDLAITAAAVRADALVSERASERPRPPDVVAADATGRSPSLLTLGLDPTPAEALESLMNQPTRELEPAHSGLKPERAPREGIALAQKRHEAESESPEGFRVGSPPRVMVNGDAPPSPSLGAPPRPNPGATPAPLTTVARMPERRGAIAALEGAPLPLVVATAVLTASVIVVPVVAWREGVFRRTAVPSLEAPRVPAAHVAAPALSHESVTAPTASVTPRAASEELPPAEALVQAPEPARAEPVVQPPTPPAPASTPSATVLRATPARVRSVSSRPGNAPRAPRKQSIF